MKRIVANFILIIIVFLFLIVTILSTIGIQTKKFNRLITDKISQTKNINLSLITPFLIGSIPFAFIGGSISIEKNLFEVLLFLILLTAGFLLFIESKSLKKNEITIKPISKFISIIIGSIIGFFSGLIGIGGGIFLSPILFLLQAEKPRIIATTASLFILINSISGVLGQFSKENVIDDLVNYWPLFFSVLLGGLIGNYLNLKIFSNRALTIMTSLLVIFVSVRMGFKIFF